MFDVTDLTREEAAAIDEALEQYDAEHIPLRLNGRISIGIRDGGRLIAGLNAELTCYKILYLGTLFVQEDYRRKGLGKMLITELEGRAKQIGVNLIRVDSFDWQGKDFYLAMGYETAGSYRCAEDGFEEYFFIKRL